MPEFPGSDAFVIDENGKATVSEQLRGASPTQEQLSDFVKSFRGSITSLFVFADNFDKDRPLNIEALGALPNVKTLELRRVCVEGVKFTASNTPALEKLYLHSLMTQSSKEVKLDLCLPKLRFLDVQYIRASGRTDFGLCLSRCPSLEEVKVYKLRFPKGSNVMILPKCRKLLLERSECTDNVEIVHAPYLEEFSVNGSFDMRHVRLWDVPNEMNAGDVRQLRKEYEKCKKERGKALWREKKKWREEEYDGTTAYNKGWIPLDEVEFFHYLVKNDTRFKVMKALEAEVDSKQEKMMIDALERLIEKVSNRPVVRPKESMPKCEVRSMNALLDDSSLLHLKSNKRVKVVESGLSFM